MKILLTGANGFVGRKVLTRLQSDGVSVRAAARSVGDLDAPWVVCPALGPDADWAALLEGIDVVIHTAGIAHRTGVKGMGLARQFEYVNVSGTLRLARQALQAGVKRFLFVSSIGVNGSVAHVGSRFSEHSVPSPRANYAVSKWRAEQQLELLLADQAMDLVIVRPPLVYAGHAPGNFQRLLKLISIGVPLPLAAVNNQRSLVALENLADFIILCAHHPAAASETFLISDGTDLSTVDIIRYVAEGMGQKARLLPVDTRVMRLAATMIGKRSIYEQLCESLVVDSDKARRLLGWRSLVSPKDALRQAGRDYRQAGAVVTGTT